MRTTIMTVSELRKAIKKADVVMIQVRFGVYESWIKISKIEATVIANSMSPDTTPGSFEMYSGEFGYVEDGTLYLG